MVAKETTRKKTKKEITLKKIKKRNGRVLRFDQNKITKAIFKAFVATRGQDLGNEPEAKKLSDKVVKRLERKFDGHTVPSVEDIQDIVEKTLVKSEHFNVAKSYILYRQKHKKIREMKSDFMGINVDTKFTMNALTVLKKRYLKKDEKRKILESPDDMFRRVASNIASADDAYKTLYNQKVDAKKSAETFYKMIRNMEFMPNSPTLMNAGRDLQQLSACFVLPIEDSMEGIFDTLKHTALIHKSGGGTGFSFSRLRPKNSPVQTTSGVASGPISFIQVYDASTEAIKQGGTRRGANMGILRVDHPDILDFITAKESNDKLSNFNLSVAVTEKFMDAVSKDEDYELIDPCTEKVVEKISARHVYDLITTMAWKNGEPGIIFIDRINEDNPTPKVGEIESTNPCGEQPLLPYESCNLGSINLAKVVNDGKVDWPKLKEIVRNSTHFMDNVIDMSVFPLKEINDMVQANRKIGLGVMGWADMLIQMEISYDSEEAVKLAEEVMSFINREAKLMSGELAEIRGTFPNFKDSTYDTPGGLKVRNATTTTIAPTGTISIISGCSSGIEPLFAVSYVRRNLLDQGDELLEVNPYFEQIAHRRQFFSDKLMKEIAKVGSVQKVKGIPEDVKKIFVTSLDISPYWHIKMQGAFQKYTDNAVSKTVNFPNTATTEEVEEVYILAYKLGCKGVTIYRDKSREAQVLNIGAEDRAKKKKGKAVRGKQTVKKTKKTYKTVDAEYAGGCEKCKL